MSYEVQDSMETSGENPAVSSPKPATSGGIQKERILAAVGYIGILALIPLLLGKDSQFAQHHGRQGLALFFLWVAWGFAGFIFSLIPLLSPLVWLGYLAMAALGLTGMYKAWKGELWQLPVIGEYAKKLKF